MVNYAKICLALCLCAVVFLMFSACGETYSDESWLQKANLDAEEMPEVLYEAALQEDTLKLYSNSSRAFEAKDSFEQQYPGLTVDIQFIRAVDLVEIFMDKERGEYVCDLLICSDTYTALTSTLAPAGILHQYIPYDIADKLEPFYDDGLLYFMLEGTQLFYSGADYESSPITNWWELTEPRFTGKLHIVDPIRSFSTYAFLVSTIQHSDEMEQAYRDLYGEDLMIPDGSTAGQEFWKQLVENQIQYVSNSDEVYKIVGTPGDVKGAVGITVSSKVRNFSLGYNSVPCYEVAPSPGTMTMSSVMMVEDAENINTAKLFVRYLLGETDGAGEGYKPYLQEGAWSARIDVQSASPVAYEDAGFWMLDKEWYADHNEWIMDFWLDLREQKENGKIYEELH